MGKIVIFLLSVTCALLPVNTHAEAQEKKAIEYVDDLPRHTYKIAGTLTELITNEKVFEPFAAEVLM